MTTKRTPGYGLYNVWRGMMGRCYDEKNLSYPRYGARGITVCARWRLYENFRSDMAPRPRGTQLDRIKNSLGYELANCRWASVTQQQRNRENNRRITAFGKTRTLAEWVEVTGIGASTIQKRLRLGWAPKDALRKPSMAGNRSHCKNGHALTPDNIYLYENRGDRQCRTCKIQYDRNRRRAIRALSPHGQTEEQ